MGIFGWSPGQQWDCSGAEEGKQARHREFEEEEEDSCSAELTVVATGAGARGWLVTVEMGVRGRQGRDGEAAAVVRAWLFGFLFRVGLEPWKRGPVRVAFGR